MQIYNAGDEFWKSVLSCPGDLGKSIQFSIKQTDSNKRFTVRWQHHRQRVRVEPTENVKMRRHP